MNGRRTFVHIGLPKTGTTFLQASLAGNREALREHGLNYPHKQDRMFRAALDVRGTHTGWGMRAEQTVGVWADLCRRADRFDGDTLISHELLAAAPKERIEPALAQLDTEVHVIVTVRDFARQVVAEWQEGIKHGRRLSFDKFIGKAIQGEDPDYASRFRASQDLPDVLDRWTGALPPERVHVVVCGPSGSERGELWHRFLAAMDREHLAARLPLAEHSNTGLSVEAIDLLRRVNKHLDGRLKAPHYGQVVKHHFAHRVLTEASTTTGVGDKPLLPRPLHAQARHLTELWVKEIEARELTVHGELSDLTGAPRRGDRHPDDVDLTAQRKLATASTAQLLLDLAESRRQVAELSARVEELQRKKRRLKRRLRQAGDED